MANELEQLVLKKAQSWLDGHYDEATKKQVKYLMDNDMKGLSRVSTKTSNSVRAACAASWAWVPTA